MDGLNGLGSREVEGHGALASVVHLEGVGDREWGTEIGISDLCTEGVALEGLDLYYVGAHVGHHGATGWYGKPIGDLEDSDAFEGWFHVTSPVVGDKGNNTAKREGVSGLGGEGHLDTVG